MSEAEVKKMHRRDVRDLLLQMVQENESLKAKLSSVEEQVTELKNRLVFAEMDLQDASERAGLLQQELNEVLVRGQRAAI
ncbi:MAG: hypothetical protein MJ075_00960 [Oscillospiraceae bacterium]|nr:hypothetical protein [Oscillospiraceae bacterium]